LFGLLSVERASNGKKKSTAVGQRWVFGKSLCELLRIPTTARSLRPRDVTLNQEYALSFHGCGDEIHFVLLEPVSSTEKQINKKLSL